MTKLQHALFACLLDGRPHEVSDLIPFLKSRVDPTHAVRAFLHHHRYAFTGKDGQKTTLQDQVDKGSRRLVLESIESFAKKGNLVLLSQTDHLEDATVQIGARGREQLRKSGPGVSSVAGGAWNEFRQAVDSGWFDLAVAVETDGPNGQVQNGTEAKSE